MRHDYETCNCMYCTETRQYRMSRTPEDLAQEQADRAANITMINRECDELRVKRGMRSVVPRETSIESTG